MSAHARPYPATVSVSPVSRTVPVRPAVEPRHFALVAAALRRSAEEIERTTGRWLVREHWQERP